MLAKPMLAPRVQANVSYSGDYIYILISIYNLMHDYLQLNHLQSKLHENVFFLYLILQMINQNTH